MRSDHEATRRLLGTAGAALLVALLVQLAAPLPAAASWSPQPYSGSAAHIRGVDCPTAAQCYAVGNDSGVAATIHATSNGGLTWAPQSSPTTQPFFDVSCPTASTCFAVGGNETIVRTTDGGLTWTTVNSGGDSLFDVSCPTVRSCWAVGHGGTILATQDGGSTWSTQSSGPTVLLTGVSCPTVTACWTVGYNGTIRATVNGGASWAEQSSGVSGELAAVSCPTATKCWAVGAGGTILATDSAGAIWSRQDSGTPLYLHDVDCPTAATCWATGTSSVIVGTDTDGVTWSNEHGGAGTLGGVDCPTASLCKAVGTNGGGVGTIFTRGGVGQRVRSSDCASASGSTNIADGFAGPLYVRAKTARSASNLTWVCFRADNGSSIAQGGVFEVDTDATAGVPAVDNAADDCTNTAGNLIPGPHPLLDASVGDPDDPPFVPVKADTWRNNSEAWVCLRLGTLDRRVRVPLPNVEIPSVTFHSDGAEPLPTPTSPPEPAYPSSACQAGSGQRVVNMDLTGAHVWIYTLQPSSSQAKVCVRAEGALDVGGALTVSTSVGVPVSVTVHDDTGPCTTDILNVISPVQLRVSRSPTGASPISVCVDQGTTHKRVTVSTSGPLVVPSVTWAPDPGTPG